MTKYKGDRPIPPKPGAVDFIMDSLEKKRREKARKEREETWTTIEVERVINGKPMKIKKVVLRKSLT